MDRNGDLVEGGIGPEMEQAMGNVGKILEAAGVERGDVAKARIYTTDTAPEAFRTINGIYEKFFEPGEVPARTTVGVKSLPLGALVEVEMAGYRKHCK